MTSTYLITGVTRGIGYGLLQAYLSRPNQTIIAAVRNPATSTAKLNALPLGAGTKLIIVKIDGADHADPSKAVAELKTKHNIDSIDVVIANAGIGETWRPVLNTTVEELREYTEINTIAPMVLFQATFPLLQKSSNPKFILMGTGVSSFTLAESLKLPAGGYGASKAAVSYLARKIHFEHEDLTTVILYPGWVRTEMGNGLAVAVGMGEASLTVDESVAGVMKQVDRATRENLGGKLIDQDGNELPW